MKLGDITRESRETFKGDKTGIPIVGLEHLIPQELTFSTYDVDTDNTFTKMFHKGQILFGRRRAYLKKAAVAEFDGICSGDITVIEAIPGKVDKDLLPFIIQNDALFDYAVSRSAGGLSPRVKWEQLSDYEINLPPLEEQKVLADKLWAAYRLKEGYKKLLCATDEMVKSQFIEMYHKTHNTQTLESVCAIISKGITPKYVDFSSVAVVNQACIQWDGLHLENIKYHNEEILFKKRTLQTGDVLLNATGTGTLGRCCVFNCPSNDNIYINDGHVIALATNKSILLPEVLNAYLSLNDTQAEIYRLYVTGSTNQVDIVFSDIKKMKVPVPNIDDQISFVKILNQADKSKFGDFKSQFIEMFGDSPTKELRDVCIQSGEYGSNTPADTYDGNTRYVRITDINDYGKLNKELVSPRVIEEKYLLTKNDLLFARTGNTVGKTYLHEHGRMIYAGYLIRYRLNKEIMLPEFAFAFTHTSIYYDWVERTKKVGAQPNISAAQYDKMPIPVPSMGQQRAFVAVAEQVDKSKSYVLIAFKNLESMLRYCIGKIA